MSASEYTAAERGGGSGDTGRMRAAILNQINSWHQHARWHDDDKADAVLAKLNEAPERFISPDPGADYREEASRIWAELKADYGLRTEADARREAREWEERAERRERAREEPTPENELGGAPAPAIDWHGHAGERAMKRAQAPALRPEHSRHHHPEPAATGPPARRYTRPLPAGIRALPRPLASVVGALWVLATFGDEPHDYGTPA